ncbi:MAG: hypothetical protein V4714_06210 [Bacteroidota bacterium]
MQRRIYLLLLLIGLIVPQAFGQVVLVDKAYDYLKKNDPQKAREFIDIASENEVTSKDPKTWYLKGFIYAELYKGNPTQPSKLRESALAFLATSIQLDSRGMYTKDCRAVIDFLGTTYYNEAVDAFNSKQYSQALTKFKQCIAIKADASASDEYAEALYYAGHTSLLLKDVPNAKIYLGKALSMNYQNPALYEELAIIYQLEGKNKMASQLLESGRIKFPEDKGLRIAEINLLLSFNELVKAEVQMEKLLLVEPKNVDVLLVAGTLYGKIAQLDSIGVNPKQSKARAELYFNKRKTIYQRVLALQANNFTANYNLGIMYYNQAVDLVNAQDFDVDAIQLNKVLEVSTGMFKEALPFMNKANQIAPNDKNTLIALEGIYYNLNEKEKSAQMREKIESMN